MHDLWIFFLRKRTFTYLLMTALSVAGIVAAIAIPKESAPEVIIPIGIVHTTLRGASAEDTERLITDKLEEEIGNLDNIDKVTSSSLEGVSVVSAQFSANANVDKSIQDLKDAVDRAKASFPKEADEPSVIKVNFADQPILIVSVSSALPPAELAKLGDDLTDEIKKVSGVSSVTVSGTRKREIDVVVKKDALEHYGLRIDQVIGAVSAANVSVPVGSITVSDVDYPIKFSGTLTNGSDVSDIVIANQNGAPIYLRDVAEVIDGLEAPTTYSRASVAGAPAENALTLDIFKRSGGDVTKITADVRTKIEELKGGMLKGSDVVVSFDNGKLVEKDLNELTRVGIETVLLVMLVLFLTIGWRESLVAALSIPLSFVIAFIGLYASGNTINFVSLFSLILAIGILVDSGIVVTEAIHTRIKIYGNAYDAAVASIREYGWPLTAGTMATVAFFFPLFFISGIVGKFISSIPFTVIFVLIASIVVALGMVPLIAIALTKEHKNRFEELQDEYSVKIRNWYEGFLGRMLDHTRRQNWFIGLMLTGLIVAIALPVAGLVKVEFFPQDDQDFIYVSVERPQGTPLAETDLATREVEEFLYGYPNVDSFVTTIGEPSAFSGNGPGDTGSMNTRLANITVNLSKNRNKTSTEIVEDLRKTLAPITSADIRVEQNANGPPSGAPVAIKFTGDDLDQITLAADRAEKLLKEIPGTLDVKTSAEDNGTRFEFSIDRAKAGEAGLTAADVANVLHAAVSGTVATTIKSGQKDVDVLVKLDLNPDFINPEDTTKANIDSIKQILISTPTGTVLLGSLISVAPTENRASIDHEDRKRIVTLSANLVPGKTALEVTDQFKKRMNELDIPAGVSVDFGGENEDINRSFTEMGFALLAGMLLVLAILVLEFNAFRFSLYLLSIIPLSVIGVMLGLFISGQALSFSSMLGLIALAGVIINHAIILLDSMIHRLRKNDGRPLREIIIESASVRLRPIVLTTVTTVIGMIPLAGASALWGPLAFAIMFGLLFAMLLTLVLVPILFYRWPGKEFRTKKPEN